MAIISNSCLQLAETLEIIFIETLSSYDMICFLVQTMFVISRFHYSTKFNFLQLAMFVFEIGDCFQGSDTWPGDITGQFFISVMDFLPPDTYPWPGDITGQFFLSVLDFLPQTPTPGLGITLVSSYTPRNEVVGGYTGFTMSVRPSVCRQILCRTIT